MELTDQYLLQCKDNYFNGITPSNYKFYSLPEYKRLIDIGKKCIKEIGILEFSYFFQESQYFIELWTAHIIFEHGDSNANLKEQSVKIIKKYSNSTLNIKIADEEKTWINKFLKK